MNRRNFLLGSAAIVAAPAIVRAESLMKIWVPPAEVLTVDRIRAIKAQLLASMEASHVLDAQAYSMGMIRQMHLTREMIRYGVLRNESMDMLLHQRLKKDADARAATVTFRRHGVFASSNF